jgi:hypothetical protein
MKVAYLEGAQLDYWVARAQGIEGIKFNYQGNVLIPEGKSWTMLYSPSTNWALAGPIIEKEQIELICDFGRWMARHGQDQQYCRPSVHALVAAMRVYLMGVYGHEVPRVSPLPKQFS